MMAMGSHVHVMLVDWLHCVLWMLHYLVVLRGCNKLPAASASASMSDVPYLCCMALHTGDEETDVGVALVCA